MVWSTMAAMVERVAERLGRGNPLLSFYHSLSFSLTNFANCFAL